MDVQKVLLDKNEKPLERLVEGYSFTSIFRTMAFVGDSLSSGEFETRDENGEPGYHDLYEYSWGQFIARKNGLKAYNFSKGGMTAKEYLDSFADKEDFWNPQKACQAYVIALGANDLKQDLPVGTVEDICKEDYTKNKHSFAGYYGAIVSRYKEISPDAKFFFVTFPPSDEADREERGKKMTKLLVEMASFFENAYVINLHEYAPIYNQDFRDLYYLYGHLNPMGYVLSAKLIDSYIDYIIRHNYRDFKHVGLIGTDIFYKNADWKEGKL